MGDKRLFVCATCASEEWLEFDDLGDYFTEHSGHKIMMWPPEAIGDVEPFEKALDILITLLTEKGP